MLPGDRLICAFIEPRRTGHGFKDWPLHVTIIPWFRLEDTSESLAAGLRRAFTGIAPFKSTVRGTTRLGPKKDRSAHLLDTEGYPELEKQARKYLRKKRAWLVDETTKARRPYLPHVTFQDGDHLEEGSTISCDRIYIVAQKGDRKTVESEIML